jgi:3-oxoacyl-[acyl-carrier protein] reductase
VSGESGYFVITGAASGIGRSTAELLARRGPLLLIDRAADQLDDLASTLSAAGPVLTFCGDVSDEGEVGAAFASLPEDAVVQGLVNSAGIFEHHPAAEMPTSAWRRVLGVNLDGTFFCCREASPHLRPGSVVVNVASLNAHVALPNRVNYAASKAAVMMLSKCLAVEWAPRGVRVVSVSPGVIDTPMHRRVLEELHQPDATGSRVPLDRLGTSAEVAGVIDFLCSGAASYVTGVDVLVDGGLVSYGAM